MTTESIEDMRSACHVLAEHILRRPCRTNRCKWLQQQLVDLLTNQDHILWYAENYSEEYPYADIRNSYLVDVLKAYDQEANS